MAFIRLLILVYLLSSVASLQQLLIYGLGNVGRAVAENIPSCWIVKGTQREPHNDKVSIPFCEASKYLSIASHVLITIPPTPDVSPGILSELQTHLSFNSWVGFVSTSGVYGNHDGTWVQEDSSLFSSSSAFKYVHFEQELQQLASVHGWKACIFRCAGLYGPNRSALHTLWKKGKPSDDVDEAFITNRIHEHDVARAIVSAMQKEDCSGIYNLSDDEPATREVVMEYALQLFQRNAIALSQRNALETLVQPTTRATRRQNERKLVDNFKMKSELVKELLYPTYRDGLDAIFADRSNPWWNDG